jgi:hypothetical protein
MVEAASGARDVFAHIGLPGPPRMGRYGVNLAAFERVALPTLRTPRKGGVVIVDELGKVELASAPFRGAVVELLGRDVAVVASVHLARHWAHRCTQTPPRHPGDPGHRSHPRRLGPATHGRSGRQPDRGTSLSTTFKRQLEKAGRAKQAVRQHATTIWAVSPGRD